MPCDRGGPRLAHRTIHLPFPHPRKTRRRWNGRRLQSARHSARPLCSSEIPSRISRQRPASTRTRCNPTRRMQLANRSQAPALVQESLTFDSHQRFAMINGHTLSPTIRGTRNAHRCSGNKNLREDMMNEPKKPEEVEPSPEAQASTTEGLTTEAAAPSDSELELKKLDGVAGGKAVTMGPDLWE